MHGGDNPRSVSSNSVCHQTENTWAELREPCAKLIWYQAYGCGSFLFVFLQRGLKSSIRISRCPLQACSQFLWSPSTFFTSKLSWCLSSLSNRPPNSSGFIPFSPAHPSPALQTGRLVCALILRGLLSFTDTSGSPAGPVHPSQPLTSPKRHIYIIASEWCSFVKLVAFSVEKQDISFLFWFLSSHFPLLPRCC